MGPKRDHTAIVSQSDDETPSAPSIKRRRDQAPAKAKPQEPKVDATYGQRSAFPGLDGPLQLSDDDLEYEDAGDALSYLRSVRHEARDIPNLLVAAKAGPQLPPGYDSGSGDPDRSIYESGIGDCRGYYEDGAYIAAPDTESFADLNEYGGEDDAEKEQAVINQRIREAWYASLSSRFMNLRKLLHKDPPQELVEALPEDHETYVGRLGARGKGAALWTRRIRNTDPLPVQIASMDTESVLKLLRVILKGNFISRGYELRERTSRWVWALLARLPDGGQLDHHDVSWVRELGKRAVLMLVSQAHMAALREQVQDGLEGTDAEEQYDFDDEFDDEIDLGEEVDSDDKVEANSGEEAKPGEEVKAGEAKPGEEMGLIHEDGEILGDPPNQLGDVDQVHGGPNEVTVVTNDENGEMDMDIDEGEVSDDPGASIAVPTNIGATQPLLLAHPQDSEPGPSCRTGASGETDTNPAANTNNQDEQQEVSDKAWSQINASATLNMIITIAGEFYGQRDLLEFRNPFPTL